MFVLPLGVEAKTRDFPFATITLVALVFFYSLLYMKVSTHFIEAYMEIPERRAYQVELKSYLTKRCFELIDQATCQVFKKEVLPEQLQDAGYVVRQVRSADTGRSRLKADQLQQLATFLKPWMNENDVLKYNESDAGYVALRAKLLASQARVKAELQRQRLYSVINQDAVSLARAQFLHGGWMHLLGNMLFLLLLAFPVEQRLGAGMFIFVYMLSGSVGLMAHTLMSSEGLYILGASANVFGIAGAFMALFYKQRMRLWLSFFFIGNRIVVVPVVVYFAIWVIAEEILGVASIDGSNVAHGAHLAGFAVGFLTSVVFQKLSPLDDGLIYPYEKIIQIRAQRTVKPAKLFRIFQEWLTMNPSSQPAAMGVLISGQMLMKENSKDGKLREFLSSGWPELVHRYLKNPDFVEKIPLDWLKLEYLKIDPVHLRQALQAHHNTNHERAEWVILIYVLWGQQERGFPELDARFAKLNEKVLQQEEFIESLQLTIKRSPELAQFFEQRGIWLAQSKESYAV